MKKTRTRILSLLLALVICLGLLPMTAMAAGGSSGEPALFLDPWNTGSFGPVAVDPFLQPQIVPAGRPESAPYTVRLLDQDSGKVIETSDSYEAWQTLNLRNRYGTTGYDFVSITPGTAHSYDPDKKILTYYPQDNIDITIRSYYLDFDHTITFDLNGAGSTQTEKVKNGSPSIPKPADPTLPGYRFLGWYEGEPGSDGYLHSYCLAKFDQVVSKDRTFYAMWAKESPSSFIITFDPNGGTVSPTTKQTDADGRVSGGYPTPTREGYKFLGWFTDGDGYQPKEDEAWSGNQTLIAKWEKASAGPYTVTFDWNGAFISPIVESVKSGERVRGYSLREPYGGIHRVAGWATEDGTAWNFQKGITQDMTLYAIWEPKMETVDPAVEDTFQFGNSDSYINNYTISKNYLEYLTENEPTSYADRINALHGQSWGGSCFGMSAVYCMGRANQIGLSTFQSGAKRLWDLSAPNQSQNIQDLINFYMLSQCTKSSVIYYQKFYFTDPMTPAQKKRTIASRYEMIVDDIKEESNSSSGFSLLGFDY